MKNDMRRAYLVGLVVALAMTQTIHEKFSSSATVPHIIHAPRQTIHNTQQQIYFRLTGNIPASPIAGPQQRQPFAFRL